MNIDLLPPELLAIILSKKQITLKERIKLRAVSSHWLTVIEAHVLKKITELEINDGNDLPDDDESSGNILPVPSTDEHTQQIARLLPAVADLKIDVQSLNAQVPLIISLCTTKLTTLSLTFFASKDQPDDPLIQAVCDAINSLPKLSSLELRPFDLLLQPMIPLLAPTVARLQRFTYFMIDLHEAIDWKSLHNSNLTHLKFEGPTIRGYELIVADIVAMFPFLQSLTLDNPIDAHLIDILRHLSSLKGLTELGLRIAVQLLLYPNANSDNEEDHDDGTVELPMPSLADQPLTGVRKLDLQLDSYTGYDEHLVSSLMAWFPRLTKLNINDDYYAGNWPETIMEIDDEERGFQLTSTLLEALARQGQLTELILPLTCIMEEPLTAPTGRPLSSVETLDLRFREDFDIYIDAKHFCAPLVAWFPYLKSLTLQFDIELKIPLTSTILRDLSSLEHLSKLELTGLHVEMNQLSLPSATDRLLVSVKELDYAVKVNLTDDHGDRGDFDEGKHFCSTLCAWFPSLKSLTSTGSIYTSEGDGIEEMFQPTIAMLAEGVSSIEPLTELSLTQVDKDQLKLPSPTDQLLTSVEVLNVELQAFYLDLNNEDRHTAGEYIGEVIVAWFPNLTTLSIDVWDLEIDKLTLTTTMLRQLARLESLITLELPQMYYEKPPLNPPSPTDRPLTSLKQLELTIANCLHDGRYFCQTLAAWFPRLEKLTTELAHDHDESSIHKHRHYFGSSIQLFYKIYTLYI